MRHTLSSEFGSSIVKPVVQHIHKFKLSNRRTAPNFQSTNGQNFMFELLTNVTTPIFPFMFKPPRPSLSYNHSCRSAYSYFIVVKNLDPGAGYMRHNLFCDNISIFVPPFICVRYLPGYCLLCQSASKMLPVYCLVSSKRHRYSGV
jgi:hypothetical protein